MDQTKEGQDRFVRFLKAFEGIEKAAIRSAEASFMLGDLVKKQIEANAKLVEIVNKSIDANHALFDVIGKPGDGAIQAIDDLIVETQGLRQDLRDAMKANGLGAIFGPIFGSKGGRRK